MPDSIEAFLTSYPPSIQAISRELRAMVRDSCPGAHELLYARHNHFDYSVTGTLRVGALYICPLQAYVRLGFFYGGRLADPDHLLMGEGKRLRHVKVRTLEEARQPALRQLVAVAWTDARAAASSNIG